MQARRLLTFGLLIFFVSIGTQPLLARPFMGLNIGFSSFQYPEILNGVAVKAYGGYRFDDLPLSIEADFLDSGDADHKDRTGAYWLQGVLLAASLRYEFDEKIDYYIRSGVYQNQFRNRIDNHRETSSGLLYGLGAIQKTSENVYVRFEWDVLYHVQDGRENHNVDVFSIGLQFFFAD